MWWAIVTCDSLGEFYYLSKSSDLEDEVTTVDSFTAFTLYLKPNPSFSLSGQITRFGVTNNVYNRNDGTSLGKPGVCSVRQNILGESFELDFEILTNGGGVGELRAWSVGASSEWGQVVIHSTW